MICMTLKTLGRRCYQCSYNRSMVRGHGWLGGWDKCNGHFSRSQALLWGIESSLQCISNCYIRVNRLGGKVLFLTTTPKYRLLCLASMSALSYTLISVTWSGHVKHVASPFFWLLYDHLPGFVTVDMPCTSDMMTGLVNPCQKIGICGHHLLYITVFTW